MIETRSHHRGPGLALLSLVFSFGVSACSVPQENLAIGPSTRISEKSIEVDGIEVHYDDWRGGAPIVFVHGAFGEGRLWRNQMEQMAHTRRMIAIDLPGHGRSDAPRIEYTRELLVRVVDAVLDDARVDSATFVGHSLGSVVVRDYALAFPEKVDQLVLVDGLLVPLVPEESREATLEPFRGEDFEQAATAFIDTFMFGADSPDDVRAFVREMMLSVPRHVWISVLEVASSPDILDETTIPARTLGIYTQNDYIPEGYDEFLANTFPRMDFQTVPEGVGHYIMLEQSTELSATLTEFTR